MILFIVLVTILVMALVSISMGKSIRNNKVNYILLFACIILCLFNFFILTSAYYKLLTSEANLSFVVTGIYLVSYLVPPMIFDH